MGTGPSSPRQFPAGGAPRWCGYGPPGWARESGSGERRPACRESRPPGRFGDPERHRRGLTPFRVLKTAPTTSPPGAFRGSHAPFSPAGSPGLPPQPALGTAHRGHPQPQPQMRSDPQPPQMGDSLAVEKYEVGHPGEPPEGALEQRPLPKREKARDVGERRLPHGERLLDHLKVREREDHDARHGPAAETQVGDVRPGHGARGTPEGGGNLSRPRRES